MKVLLLEDDRELALLIVRGIRRAGLAVDHVTTLAEADIAVSVSTYDVLVLDRAVPDADALDFIAALRRHGDGVPSMLLTGRDTVRDRVAGFDHGADDYLVKPFAGPELIARIRALIRRGGIMRLPVLRVADLEVDVSRHRVSRRGIGLSLRPKEFAVLELLARSPGDVVSRTELIESCWDEQLEPASNVVDVVIGQLRRRLGAPDLVETVRGVGYALRADAA